MLFRVINFLFVAAIIVAVVTVGVAFLMPDQWSVRQTILIGAPAERIFADVETLERWPDWTVWNTQRDPTLVVSFEGPASGVGAQYRWTSEHISSGELVVVEHEPARRLAYEMKLGDEQTPAAGAITLEPSGDSTYVTWKCEGQIGGYFWMRLMVPFLEAALDQDISEGLSRLKSRAETARETPPADSQPATPEPAAAARHRAAGRR